MEEEGREGEGRIDGIGSDKKEEKEEEDKPSMRRECYHACAGRSRLLLDFKSD